MEITALDIFRIEAPEFDGVPDATVQTYIQLAKPLVSKKKFGDMYTHALALVTAHNMKMHGLGDSSSGKIDDALRVGSYSEGSTSISYNASQGGKVGTDGEYALTTYGMQFLTLSRNCIVPIVCSAERF